jgi:hypothetical protein
MVCKRSDQNIYTISYKSVYLIQKQKCPTGTEKRRWLVINLVPPFSDHKQCNFFFFGFISCEYEWKFMLHTTDNSPKEFMARYSRTNLYICFISYQEKRNYRALTSNEQQYE